MGKGNLKTGAKSCRTFFKKRCCNGDEHKAQYQDWDGKYYCKYCWREME